MKYVLLGGLIVAVPFTFVFCMPAMTLRMLYGEKSPYVVQASLLRIALLDYGMMYISFVAGAWLSGVGESRASCVAQSVTVAATALIALPLTMFFGVAGLFWGALIALACGAGAAVCLLLGVLSRSTKAPHANQAPMLSRPPERYAA